MFLSHNKAIHFFERIKSMIIVFIRTLLLYIFVLISMRLMGPGELSQMQPFQLVIIMMIAELAALPMGDTGLPLLNGFIAILGLLFAEVVISYINLKSERARGIICGKPSVLINKGLIDEKELRKLRININDLMEQIRSKDYHNIADVEFAILETNGDLSIVPKSHKRPVTMEDMHLRSSYDGLPFSIILDGHVNEDNLEKANLSKEWLDSQLHSHGINNVKEVLICYIDAKKELYIQKKDAYKR